MHMEGFSHTGCPSSLAPGGVSGQRLLALVHVVASDVAQDVLEYWSVAECTLSPVLLPRSSI